MPKPTILFFARGYQADFYPHLRDDRYDAIYVTLTRAERRRVEAHGIEVAACFEEDFNGLPLAEVEEDYLLTSFMSDRFLGRYDLARRREILGKEVSFWRQLLDRFKPAAVVNELVALEISEVLLIETRRRDIRYLAPMNAPVEGRFYWLPNPISFSGRHLPPVRGDVDALALAKRAVDQLQTKDWRPYYIRNLAGRRALRPFLIALVKAVVWHFRRAAGASLPFRYESYDEEYSKRIAVFLKSLWLKYDEVENLPAGREVILYPLHQEPEAMLNYMSEFYANQVFTIENILKCLTPDQILVVKEHPVDKGSLLRRKFWNLRKRYSGLYFLPAETHAGRVLTVAERVVTLTSSVGWEAAVNGKRVHVLGNVFYDALENVETIRDFPQLRATLRTPADEGKRVSREQAEELVARVTEISHPGNALPHAELYSSANIRNVVEAIVLGAGF